MRHLFTFVFSMTSFLFALSACSGSGAGDAQATRQSGAQNDEGDDAEVAISCSDGLENYKLTGDGSVTTPYLLCSAADIYLLSQEPSDWDKNFLLGADIDLSQHYSDGGTEFKIGSCISTNDSTHTALCNDATSAPFTGTLDGAGHSISNFVLTSFATRYQGLFAYTHNATLKNLRVLNTRPVGTSYIGGVVAVARSTTFEDMEVSVTIEGGQLPFAGGLVGVAYDGEIRRVQLSVSINGQNNWFSGGVAGYTRGTTLIEKVSVCGSILGMWQTAGMVGVADGVTIRQSKSSANVTQYSGGAYTAGLIAISNNAQSDDFYTVIEDSYVTGSVLQAGSWGAFNGGLVARAYRHLEIKRSYTTGSLTGQDQVGGLVGSLHPTASRPSLILNSFTTGAQFVSGNHNNDGRLTGVPAAVNMTFTNNHVSNQSQCRNASAVLTTAGCSRVTETAAHDPADFFDASHVVYGDSSDAEKWDFEDIWFIDDGVALPVLRWEL